MLSKTAAFGRGLLASTFAWCSTAVAQEWHQEGPVGRGDDRHCLVISPDGLGLRRTASPDFFELAFFEVVPTDIAGIPADGAWSGGSEVSALMVVDDNAYLAWNRAILGEPPSDTHASFPSVYISSSDFHFFEALQRGKALRLKVTVGIEAGFDFNAFKGKAVTYPLAGSSHAIRWLESCTASLR